MNREDLISSLTGVVEGYERSVRETKPADAYKMRQIEEDSVRVRELIPKWADCLLFSSVKVSGPRVLRARSTYDDSMLVHEAGLYVAVQAVLTFPGGSKKVFDIHDITGHQPYCIPCLNTDVFLGHYVEGHLVQHRPDLLSFISSRVSLLSAPLVEARRAAEEAAPGLVRGVRSATAKDDQMVVAKKLLPHLRDNPLAALPPASLALIFQTPWKELERIVAFLKTNRAVATGVDADSMEYIMGLITALEVMES